MANKKIKIQIKSWTNGSVLFEYSSEDNTIAKTVEEAVKSSANLRYADLRSADLRSADLRSANLSSANLSSADLRSANLRSANLRSANLSYANLSYADLSSANLRYADLRYADLRSIPFEHLPTFWVNLCSRDILFVLEHLKGEVPFLKEKLISGGVDGTQYQGECACLIGTLGNADGGIDKICSVIPYYEMDSYNPGEQWFLQIKEGDTPEDNVFSKHAVQLCNQVLGLPLNDGLEAEENPPKTR